MSKFAAATKWLAALAITITFLIGIPLLLLNAPSPLDSERGIASIFDAIGNGGQIFDEAIISVLVGIAWVLWAYLLLAALAEVFVAVRGGVTSIRGLSLGQSFARPVIAALMWSSTATGLAASTLGAGTIALATAPAASAQPVNINDGITDTNHSSFDRHGFGDPIPGEEIVDLEDGTFLIRGVKVRPHVVETDDTMWDLAEASLGDGFRWREIANLNPDIDDPDLIAAGSLLYLPAEATNVNAPATPEPQASAPVVVEEGDTLWDLAGDHLEEASGDQPAGDQIAAVIAEVDRTTLASGDPDLIYPGEIIELAEPELIVWTADTAGTDAEANADTVDELPVVDGSGAEADLAMAIQAAEDGMEDVPADLVAETPEVVVPADPVAETPEVVVPADPVAETPEVVVPADPVAETPEAEAGDGLLEQPPSGIFMGQFAADGAPPGPAQDADILIAETPPIPATTDGADETDGVDETNGWDPAVTAADAVDEVPNDPAATPSVLVPGGVPVQPEVNTTVDPEDLAEPAEARTVKSLNWSVLLAVLPLLGGGVWAALRRRRRLTASRRPSRYAATEMTEDEQDVTEALAGSSAIERAAKLQALSAQIAQWVPRNAPSLIAVTVDDETVAVLWDADLAPESVGDQTPVKVDGANWLISVDALVSTIDAHQIHGLPALVHVGRLLSGRDLFVNLEELGRLNLSGEPRAIERFCGRLAMELALSPLFDLGTLVLIGFGKQLAAIDNIEHYDSSDDALRSLAPRLPSLERALATDSALQLRAAGQLDSDISPVIVIDLSDAAPNAELVASAEASVGGLCMLHAGEGDSDWPLSIDHDHVHVGGALDVSVNNAEADEETIGKILAIVSKGIEYEPADTIEGAVSDTIAPAMPEPEAQDPDEWRAEVVSLEQPDHEDQDFIDLSEAALVASSDDTHMAEVSELVFLPDPDPLPATTGVRLRMLGPVSVEGAEFSKKAKRYIELLALMLARGGKITVHEISTHMFNGEGSEGAVHALLTRTRKALGQTADGQPRLSFETPTKQYELTDVCSDYQQLLEACERIKTDDTLTREEACQLMDSAAQLIEGPPYAASGQAYDWVFTAGEASQAILAADSLCRELGEVYLALGNYPRARWSIRQGLKACPACDELYEALIRVVAMDGTRSDLKALWGEIEASYDAADLEVPHSLATAYGLAVA